MPLYKSAQLFDQNFLDEPESEVILYKHPNEEDMVEVEQELEPAFKFELPPLPGFELVVEEDREPIVEEKKEEKSKPKDMWDRNGRNVLEWAQERCNSFPPSNGKSGGIEREIACYKKLRNEMSKAISEDLYGTINADQFEVAVERIDERIEKLEDILEKLTGKGKKKKAGEEDGLVKEGRSAYVGGMVVVVPLLISRIARGMINSTVSSGHDIYADYQKQIKKYDLSLREQAELLQHLEDCGYPMRSDRLVGPNEVIEVSTPAGELAANYFS